MKYFNSAPMQAIYPTRTKLGKLLTFAGAVWAVCAVLFTLFGGLFLARLAKCVISAQKALPEMEKAAKLYVRKNQAPESDAPEV